MRYPGVAKGLYVASPSGSSNFFLDKFSLICFPSEVFLVTIQNSKVHRNCIDMFSSLSNFHHVSVFVIPLFVVKIILLYFKCISAPVYVLLMVKPGKPALSKVEVLERDSQLNQTLVQVPACFTLYILN